MNVIRALLRGISTWTDPPVRGIGSAHTGLGSAIRATIVLANATNRVLEAIV